jgi:hypothetical protein
MFVIETCSIEDEQPDTSEHEEWTSMELKTIIGWKLEISEEQREIQRDNKANDIPAYKYE